MVAVFYVLLVRTTLAAAREELLRTRAFVRMIPSRILSREASLHLPPFSSGPPANVDAIQGDSHAF